MRFDGVAKVRKFIERYPTEATLFCVALIVRLTMMLFLAWRFGSDFYTAGNSDSFGYLDLGKSVADGRGFQMYGITSAMRTPAYPLFVSLFYLFHIPLAFIPVVQSCLAGASAVMLFSLGRIFFRARAGWIAAALFALEPYGILLANTAVTETLFVFFLLVSLYFFARWLSIGASRTLPLFSGMALGLATLTRPLTAYLPIFFAAFFLWRFRQGNWRALLAPVGIFFIVFLGVLAPWSVRQYRAFGSVQLTNLDTTLLYLRVLPIAEAKIRGVDYRTAISLLVAELPEKISNFDEAAFEHTFAYTDVLSKEARTKIFSEAPTVARYFAASLPSALFATGYDELLELFGVPRPGGDANFTLLLHEGRYREFAKALLGVNLFHIIFLLGVLAWGTCYALLLWSAIIAWRKERDAASRIVFVLLLAGFFVFFASGPLVYVRYRLLSYPFLFLAIGYAADLVFRKRPWYRVGVL